MFRQDEDGIPPEQRHIMSDKQLVAQPTRKDSPYSQNKQRQRYHQRRFMHMRHYLGRCTRLAMEGHYQQPPAVKGCEESRRTTQPERHIANIRMRGKGRFKDEVLRVESCQEGESP